MDFSITWLLPGYPSFFLTVLWGKVINKSLTICIICLAITIDAHSIYKYSVNKQITDHSSENSTQIINPNLKWTFPLSSLPSGSPITWHFTKQRNGIAFVLFENKTRHEMQKDANDCVKGNFRWPGHFHSLYFQCNAVNVQKDCLNRGIKCFPQFQPAALST